MALRGSAVMAFCSVICSNRHDQRRRDCDQGKWNYTPHLETFGVGERSSNLTPLRDYFSHLFFVQSGYLIEVFFDGRMTRPSARIYWARYRRLAPLLYVNRHLHRLLPLRRPRSVDDDR